MEASRPYAERMRRVIGHLSQVNPEYPHPYLVQRPVRRVGYIVVSSDRGLCGGLNVNLFRKLLADFAEWQREGVELDICLIGNKAVSFFRRLKLNVVAATTHLGETPQVADLVGAIKIFLDAYQEGRVDKVFIAHNEFVNTMTQRPLSQPLLPVEPVDAEELQQYWDYIYEPSAAELLEVVLDRYIESQVYRAVVENVACEQAARMVAMKSATDNAGTLIEDLQLVYNKARQAAITKEISEIVGGAAAV
jgi:F-type H+-transporting ATPase subunit gamma